MLGGVLAAVSVLVVVFVVVAATRPSAYRVERQVGIDAPAERVFGVLDDLRQFAPLYVLFGTPLEKHDPNLTKTVSGPASGVGQVYAWSGKGAGAGSFTLEQSVPSQKVVIKLVFTKPMASTALCTLNLAVAPAGTQVTWTMEGHHNFLGKAAGLLMNMDNALGADLEKSLAQLKSVAETR